MSHTSFEAESRGRVTHEEARRSLRVAARALVELGAPETIAWGTVGLAEDYLGFPDCCTYAIISLRSLRESMREEYQMAKRRPDHLANFRAFARFALFVRAVVMATRGAE